MNAEDKATKKATTAHTNQEPTKPDKSETTQRVKLHYEIKKRRDAKKLRAPEHIRFTNDTEDRFGTGPIDTEAIKSITAQQQRTNALNAKQKKKHERIAAEAANQPIQLKRLRKSFKYAFQGILYVFKTQPNMKIHGIIGTIAVTLGFLFHISEPEWLAVVIVIGFMIILEVINTAIETLVDLYTEDFSFLAGVSKDVGAATVLVMAIVSVIVGLIVFLPKFITLFQTLFEAAH